MNEETGWKLVHGDVFRAPSQRMLLAACVGTGGQLCLLGLFVILITIMGTFYEVGWVGFVYFIRRLRSAGGARWCSDVPWLLLVAGAICDPDHHHAHLLVDFRILC